SASSDGGRARRRRSAPRVSWRALEFSERGKNAARESPVGGRRVDLRTGAGQNLQPDAPGAQVLDRVDQVTQVAPEPVELPEHQRVAGLDRLQAGCQSRAGIVAA